jgi:hypothetical protein
MSKPVSPQEMFDLWQKMVNPGAYPLQSLMFPLHDAKEIEKKIAELEVVEHWLKANVNMLQLTIKSLQFQLAMLKGGEKAAEVLRNPGAKVPEDVPDPANWAWSMMAQAGKDMVDATADATKPRATRKKKKRA